MALPSGWTGDINIVLPERSSLEEVVDLVISLAKQGVGQESAQRSLIEDLGLSPDDAALAWDRVHAGVVRASTKNSANCPDRSKDPLAWLSFQRASQDQSVIASLYPQHFESESKRPWWKFW